MSMILYIDITTAQNLELLSNSRDPGSLHSLFGVLNHTRTNGGGTSVIIIVSVLSATS